VEDAYYLSMRVVVTETGEIKRSSVKNTKHFEDMEELTSAAVEDLLKTEIKRYGEKRQGVTFLSGIYGGWTFPCFTAIFSIKSIQGHYFSISAGGRIALLFPLGESRGQLYTGIHVSFGNGLLRSIMNLRLA